MKGFEPKAALNQRQNDLRVTVFHIALDNPSSQSYPSPVMLSISSIIQFAGPCAGCEPGGFFFLGRTPHKISSQVRNGAGAAKNQTVKSLKENDFC